jgi:hypothetical protein
MANQELKYQIRFRYRGGAADDNLLDLYDGTKSIHGFARALQIAAHGFIHHDVIHHATALRGARLYLKPPQRGSFLNDIVIVITQNPIPSSMAAAAFYDFLKFSVGKAVGKFCEPETPSVSRLNTSDEPFFDELGEAMEGALLDGHRTIQSAGGTITMERPRSELLTFNQETLSWVRTRDENPVPEDIIGNITRYNVLSQNGRLYDYGLERTVPFKPNPNGIASDDSSLLTWSMDQLNNGFPGALNLSVKRIRSAQGNTKRYILLGCTKHIERDDATLTALE